MVDTVQSVSEMGVELSMGGITFQWILKSLCCTKCDTNKMHFFKFVKTYFTQTVPQKKNDGFRWFSKENSNTTHC